MTETPQTSYLMDFILSVLTPLLAAGAIPDIQLARRAAMEAIAAYNARAEDELVTAAQAVTFALTALDNLRLSMTSDLSLTMKLKLRGSANALNRSALNSTQALEKIRHPKPAPAPRAAKPAASPPKEPATPQPQPTTVQPAPNDQANRLHWAAAMRREAADLRSSSTDVTPEQRQTDTMWATVLNEVANELTQPAPANPGMTRAELLRTTLLSSGQNFPAHLSTRSAIRK